MLPKHHYGESDSATFNDSSWIASKIDELPIMMQAAVSQRYSDIYLKLSNEDKRGCRRRANTWLRLTVDKYRVIHNDNGDIF